LVAIYFLLAYLTITFICLCVILSVLLETFEQELCHELTIPCIHGICGGLKIVFGKDRAIRNMAESTTDATENVNVDN